MVSDLVLQSSDIVKINIITLSFAIPVTKKLQKFNYLLWHA
jgi:hypothetical protein